jgi:hypothetical protein
VGKVRGERFDKGRNLGYVDECDQEVKGWLGLARSRNTEDGISLTIFPEQMPTTDYWSRIPHEVDMKTTDSPRNFKG